jgi:hypothetical protein
MTNVSRVLTVHAEARMNLRLALLDALEGVLVKHGATRIWIEPSSSPGRDLVVLAEFAEDGEKLVRQR